jgi:hypothetical protein
MSITKLLNKRRNSKAIHKLVEKKKKWVRERTTERVRYPDIGTTL